jgi:hypothetical protein
MTALETITAKAQEKGLRFLVIGGHAVMAHGFARATFDLDLLVRVSEREAWKSLILEAGGQLFSENDVFMQFSESAALPMKTDLMLVNEETFRKLWPSAFVPANANPQTKFVALLHLIALKCHAIKHGHAGRVEKDVDDVLQLVKENKVDVLDGEFKALILKYGLPELYEKLKRASSR